MIDKSENRNIVITYKKRIAAWYKTEKSGSGGGKMRKNLDMKRLSVIKCKLEIYRFVPFTELVS